MNPLVDDFISSADKWQDELEQLRYIVLDCGLTEEVKWSMPCYTFQKANVLILGGFKNYCALSFFKGALLSDYEQILIQQTENVHAARQLRFTKVSEIVELEPIIKAYIFEAIEIERVGLKLEPKQHGELQFPEEFNIKLQNDPTFKGAFESLTHGRKRAYHMYFSEPKQSQTREARIEKSTHRILMGKGLNDCICGLSRKMPSCDGSHKFSQG